MIIAGNLRIIPTTGITLPFVSYGGSSLVVNFLMVGMLLGISEASARERR
ncbi:MAG TPA: FtsW/RodA/SpoVE family cell cycle protein [Methanoregulaceae archaeon]|nr:FtsW/RodA/SpoVE family cell cycle protein [Methanoregulaceae archaeon]